MQNNLEGFLIQTAYGIFISTVLTVPSAHFCNIFRFVFYEYVYSQTSGIKELSVTLNGSIRMCSQRNIILYSVRQHNHFII